MPVLTKLKAMLGLRGDQTYTYECESCGAVFDATEPTRSRVSCPSCDDGSIVSAPHKSPD